MPNQNASANLPRPRDAERGNIVLIAALIVLGLGVTGIGLSRLVQSRVDMSADMRLSNYGATLAEYVAESAVNNLLYNWNTSAVVTPTAGTFSPPGIGAQTGTLHAFPNVTTTYSGLAASIVSACTYSLTVSATTPSGIPVTAIGTVTTDPSVPGSTIWPSAAYRVISRQVSATVSASAPYSVLEYAR